MIKSGVLFLKEKERPDIRGQLVILAIVSHKFRVFCTCFFYVCVEIIYLTPSEMTFYVFFCDLGYF